MLLVVLSKKGLFIKQIFLGMRWEEDNIELCKLLLNNACQWNSSWSQLLVPKEMENRISFSMGACWLNIFKLCSAAYLSQHLQYPDRPSWKDRKGMFWSGSGKGNLVWGKA